MSRLEVRLDGWLDQGRVARDGWPWNRVCHRLVTARARCRERAMVGNAAAPRICIARLDGSVVGQQMAPQWGCKAELSGAGSPSGSVRRHGGASPLGSDALVRRAERRIAFRMPSLAWLISSNRFLPGKSWIVALLKVDRATWSLISLTSKKGASASISATSSSDASKCCASRVPSASSQETSFTMWKVVRPIPTSQQPSGMVCIFDGETAPSSTSRRGPRASGFSVRIHRASAKFLLGPYRNRRDWRTCWELKNRTFAGEQ